MEKKIRKELKMLLSDLRALLVTLENRLSELSDYSESILDCKKSLANTNYYSANYPDTKHFHYIGNDTNKDVQRIQEVHFLEKQIEALKSDISLTEDYLKDYKGFSSESIFNNLPKTYRNPLIIRQRPGNLIAREWKKKSEAYKATIPPFRPEELKQPTIDGTMVRSKSEAFIYNYLFEHGYTFVYELPFEKDGKWFYPDFTILSEIDYQSVIIIEHQGAMSVETYRDGAFKREYKYWNAGMLPNYDVYFTYDTNRGAFDISPIKEILHTRVRPLET